MGVILGRRRVRRASGHFARRPADRQTVDEAGRRLDVTIDGVVHHRLGPIHADHRGSLLEIVDVRQPFWGEPIVYSYRCKRGRDPVRLHAERRLSLLRCAFTVPQGQRKAASSRSRLTESTESLERGIVAPERMTFHDCDP